jgi:hypothetical protein
MSQYVAVASVPGSLLLAYRKRRLRERVGFEATKLSPRSVLPDLAFTQIGISAFSCFLLAVPHFVKVVAMASKKVVTFVCKL